MHPCGQRDDRWPSDEQVIRKVLLDTGLVMPSDASVSAFEVPRSFVDPAWLGPRASEQKQGHEAQTHQRGNAEHQTVTYSAENRQPVRRRVY